MRLAELPSIRMIASTDAHPIWGGAVEAFLCVRTRHAMPLNHAQALSLATTLSLLEERCDEIERLLAARSNHGVLHQTLRDIPQDTHPELRVNLVRLRAEISRLAAEFQLGVEANSASRRLVALLTSSWQDLEDVRPAKL